MNRVASRAGSALILAFLLILGLGFFLVEFAGNAGEWVLFSGSPHVYSGGKPDDAVITDRDGQVLLELSGDRTYASSAALRTAMLHWTGDRAGNVNTPALKEYVSQLSGYDLLNGVYNRENASGTMTLTLSAPVQQAALEALGDRHGTVAVYNYKTGEILCAVSSPGFDPENVPDVASDDTGKYDGVYVNRFIQSVYIPGSIFKIVTTAAALETIPDILEQSFECTGTLEIGGGKVTCESRHGKQTLKQAFANSCNCAYAQITQLVGREKMERYVRIFGITEQLSFDGYTTAAGNYDLSEASTLQFAWSGIGQHLDQINPCQFMSFMGAIAGGGTGVQPYVVSKVNVGSETTYTAKTVTADRIMSRATAKTLQELLQNNTEVKYGAENFPGLTVCAKSGTGEVGGEIEPNAMFAGFVADEEYPLAFIVAIEKGGYGSKTCIPILRQVLQACVSSFEGQ